MERNPLFAALNSRYLFHEIKTRVLGFKELNPKASLISLGIGDTTEPIATPIVEAFLAKAQALGTKEGYTGYGPEQGNELLRKRISARIYQGKVAAEDIFISDGAKCDIARLQILFGQKPALALQDPSYPAYRDSALITRGHAAPLMLLPCLPENSFLPDVHQAQESDVLFLCNPNNPTGTVFTRKDLTSIVSLARARKQIIVYDVAYNFYIREDVPKSIYEIPGAEEVAIEIGSFSKIAGFSGVRLGWTVVPQELCYKDGESVKKDWTRLITTLFNGASSLAQAGGIAVLSDEGLTCVEKQVEFYLENTRLLKEALQGRVCEVFGGVNAPYLWVKFPHKSSWDAFDELLHEAHLITTPGIGFGPSGEGFLRLSGFGERDSIIEACRRLHSYLIKE